jgi:hypothetical protein
MELTARGTPSDDFDRQAGAIDDEIEVTEAMTDAASEVLAEHYMGDGMYDVRDEIMAKVYRAMHAARRRTSG